MTLILRAFILSLIMTPVIGSITLRADECNARVEHAGTTVLGSKVYTYWIVKHDPWRWATVSFRYHITYIDKNNQERKIEGMFRQIIASAEEKYTELNNARHHPARVTLTKFIDLTCYP